MEETTKNKKQKGWTQAQKKYAQSSKGKEARLRYQQSEKGRAKHKEYLARRKAKKLEAKQVQETTTVNNEIKEVKIKKEAVSKK
ncbi:MAG TPA: hypothetical protein VMY36_03075 [Patescibacteria group bacterium]|nr:hypothetical protein [Patescibacteria group bacterium]